jgi:hypothetical protein
MGLSPAEIKQTLFENDEKWQGKELARIHARE